MTLQQLYIGTITAEHRDAPSVPTYLAGRRMYAVGSTGGGIVPRGDEHLIGKMGGIWAHPYRILHGWQAHIVSGQEAVVLDQADICRVYWSHLERIWQRDVQIEWREWIAAEEPEAWVRLQVINSTEHPWQGRLQLELEWDIRLCWMGGLHEAETTLEATAESIEASLHPDNGLGVAVWSDPAPHHIQIKEQHTCLNFDLELPAGATTSLYVVLRVEHNQGAVAASKRVTQLLQHPEQRLNQQQQIYQELLAHGPQFECPDPTINQAWQLALVNLQALVAEYPPALGSYFLAGIPEYPQFFGCDTTYTVPGALAAGQREVVISALRQLGAVAWEQCGRVPHELTTNGRIFNPGNIQETPQFVLAVWDTLQWTGDHDLLAEWYPVCYESMHSYVLEHQRWGEPWVIGDGMVERYGMGPYKLDVQCYTISALHALAAMAEQLERHEEAVAQRQLAQDLSEQLNHHWWLSEAGVFADSRHLDGKLQLDGHWTVIVPIQLGLTDLERAEHSLGVILKDWVNQWGLVHTRGVDERVWTLPTGLLALALAQYGHAEQVVQCLHSMTATTTTGMLGAFEELIPSGLCFLQLWSAGLVLETIVKGLCGIQPQALEHSLTLNPCLPTDWNQCSLRNLQLGQHVIDIEWAKERLIVTHRQGQHPLQLTLHSNTYELQPGTTQELMRNQYE